MKKLISLSEFVKINEYPNTHEEAQSELVLIYNFYKKVTQYNYFLKQPLELWMFVPCDENGNVLEEKSIFNTTDEDYIFDSESFDNYQQAKEICLFEGCKARKIGDYYLISNENYTFWVSWNDSFNIESIIKHNLELTPTAIKQLEL